jgi:molybdopterin-binding protein
VIALERVTVRAGSFTLHEVTARIAEGQWGIVLGAAGSGKTTLLETIAGVRTVKSGRVLLRGVDSTRTVPELRRVGMVYQQGFLFPHLSVRDNARYGTRDHTRADALLERFGGGALVDRAVTSLSGGERQVVALVRSLARQPDILLLDEPLSALDPRGRGKVRRELRALQRAEGTTVLQVTHDFAEAGTLGDVALLMDAGRLVQVAPPKEMFRAPATAAAAEFLGAENVLAGVVTASPEGSGSWCFVTGGIALVAVGECAVGPAHAVIRGEDVALALGRGGPSSVRNVLDGVVREVVPLGAIARVTVDVGGVPIVASVTVGAVRELGISVGGTVVVSVKATAVHLC